VTSLWPGGDCDPCERGRHEKCIGWAKHGIGFCGCTQELCLLRLTTGVMWTIQREGDQ
jgi:hypothetical protein